MNKIKIVLCSFIVFCLIIGMGLGFGLYYKNLTKQIEVLEQEKEIVVSELENVKIELKTIYTELSLVSEELTQAQKTIELQKEEIKKYEAEIADEEAKWQRRYKKYPIATEAWIAMKVQGQSDTVCAGIMGNLMAETGGTGTLHLNWDSNTSSGYGLVQWTGGRRNAIKNKYGTYPSVKEQVQFIHDELYGTNGVSRQVSKSQLKAIMNAETPEECAYAFACYYERCATQYRSMRRGFARKAYEYFTD